MSAKTTDAAPATQLTDLAPQHATTLDGLASRILAARTMAEVFESEATRLTAEAAALLDTLGVSKVEASAWLAIRPAGRSSLSKELLMKEGVTARQIQLATVKGQQGGWSVRARKNGEPTTGAETE